MERFFQSLADRFIRGDLEAVAAHFTYPLVVYEPSGIEIEKTPQDTHQALAARLLSVRSGGAVDVRVHLDHVGPPTNSRHPYDVTITYLDHCGRPLGDTCIRYFCRFAQDSVRVELIEISQAFRMNALPKKAGATH